jgi:DNA-binding transcriptional ArsR family regulator
MHVLDALGNPVRRAILRELRGGPRSVGEIAAGLPVSRPAVSRHLRALEDAGLVRAHAEGARNIYAVHLRGFASVRQFVDDFWDVALARLEDVAGDDRQIRVAAARRDRRAVARRG